MEALQAQLAELQQQNAELQREVHQAQARQQPVPEVHRIAVKLPPFWSDKTALWFAQVEAQFNLAGITQEATKYSYVISHLEERFASEVEDLITSPPRVAPYTTLKAELIRRLSMSEERRVRQLLIEEELGDHTPSQFLRHLRSLAGTTTGVQDNLLRTIWMQRLPPHVQAILQTQADQEGSTSDKLAVTADKIMEVQPTISPAVIASAPVVHALSSPIAEVNLAQRLDEVCRQVAAMQVQLKALRRRETRSRSRDKSSSSRRRCFSPPPTTSSEFCWYHHRYGSKAQKCSQPCSYKSTNSTGSQ